MTRVVAILLTVYVAALALPAAASAHAQLQSTSPQQGATIKTEPKSVSFTFGESVQGTQGAVRVFDNRGKRVDDGNAFHPGGRGSTVAVGVKPGLANGTYTATYRVVSADTHVVTGGNVFSIGAPSAGGGSQSVGKLLAGQKTGAITSTAFTVARSLQYAAIGIAGGLLLFLLATWLPVSSALAGGGREWLAASRAFVERLRKLLLIVAAVGIASSAAALGLQGAEAAGVGFWSALNSTVLQAVVKTRFGEVWLAALGCWILVGIGSWRLLSWRAARGAALQPAALGADGIARPARRPSAWLLAPPLLALITLPALAGHASIESPVGLFLPANLAHVAAMSCWLGGLTALLAVVPVATRQLDAADRTRLLCGVLARFSPLALGSVIVLVATGTTQALIEIDAWSELLHTGFGRAVLIKIVLLIGLIALGAVNRQRTLPRIKTLQESGASPGAVGVVLRRTLRAEVALIAVVLIVTGALSGYAPANTVGSGPAQLSAVLGPAQLSLDVDPARVGANTMHVYLFDRKTGAQFKAVKELDVSATLPSKQIGPLALKPQLTGPGHYTIESAVLGAPGTWTLDVVARVSDFVEYEKKLKVKVR